MSGAGAAHPFFARLYARVSPAVERRGAAAIRHRLLASAEGRVLEIGPGAGANFAHYPPAVTEVVAVEPEPYLREAALQAAASHPAVRVVAGTADALPAGEGSFDAVVSTLVLCSVPDQDAALAALYRALRPGGRLFVWEHVRAEDAVLSRVQDALDATVWPRLMGGCHTGRDTAAAIERAGFVPEHLERARFPETWISGPTTSHLLGTARRPPH